jgi:ParB-like nuclease domain
MNESDKLPVLDLHFDKENPRLVEFGIQSNTPDEKILEILWESMDVMELISSISSSGFFAHEPLIVAKEDNKYVVLEGNRRLAALKILNHDPAAAGIKFAVPDISDEVKQSIISVPVIFQNT